MNCKFLFFIFLLLFLAGCVKNEAVEPINLHPAEFKEIIDSGDVFLVDVHIPEQSHIKGTDAVIPFDKLKENLDKLPKDKTIPIAVYCRSGSMSVQASKELSDIGYKHIYNLDGGVNAWRAQGFEIE